MGIFKGDYNYMDVIKFKKRGMGVVTGYIIGVHLGTTGDFLASDEVNMGVLMGTGASVQQYKDLTVAAMGLNAGDVQAIVCDKQLAENICVINEGLKCIEAVYADGTSTQEQYAVAADKGETELIVAGLQTDYCMDATVKCGFEHGFKVYVP